MGYSDGYTSPALTSWNNSIHVNEFFTKENLK